MKKSDVSKKVFENIPQLMRLLRQEIRSTTPNCLTFPQFRVLANVNRGMRHISEIADFHGVSQPAMSRIIATLIRKELIQTQKDPLDKRAKILELTPQGLKTFKNVRGNAQSSFMLKIAELPAPELKKLDDALDTLGHVIKFIKNNEAKR